MAPPIPKYEYYDGCAVKFYLGGLRDKLMEGHIVGCSTDEVFGVGRTWLVKVSKMVDRQTYPFSVVPVFDIWIVKEDLDFGKDVWVYCSQHMRPHTTGWCTVSVRDKTLLNSTSYEDAVVECEKRGFELYKGNAA